MMKSILNRIIFIAKEVAEKWMVSSRMVAYYCESGRIDGAVKKGKTWFVHRQVYP